MMKAAAGLLLIFFATSCTTTIRPPRDVAQPATVAVITHGISSSLVLTDETGRAARFAYGDWRFYALGRSGFFEGAAALLWPTRSALGRQVIESGAELGIAYEDVFPLCVERAAVDALWRELDALFAANAGATVFNPQHRLEFVPHPEPYSLFSNSNQKIAEWLRRLGADTSGWPLLPRWRVESYSDLSRSSASSTDLRLRYPPDRATICP